MAAFSDTVIRSFAGVSVSVPTGPVGSAGSEGVHFVPLGGDGQVDVHENGEVLLGFSGPNGALQSRSIGNVIRASAIAHDREGCSLDVKTEGRGGAFVYRLRFNSRQDTAGFDHLAAAAESREMMTWQHSEQGRSEKANRLEAALQGMLVDRQPLVYGGVQLFGRDLNGEALGAEEGAEFLIGDGALVMLDPPSAPDGRVGAYDLHFYSEDQQEELEGGKVGSEPLRRLPLGPRMMLLRQRREKADEEEEEPAVCFDLRARGGGEKEDQSACCVIAFSTDKRAAEFERDLNVRLRLMDVAWKASRCQQDLDGARGQLDSLLNQRCGGILRFWGWIQLVVTLLVLLLLVTAAYPGTQTAALTACARLCNKAPAAESAGPTMASNPLHSTEL